MGWGFLEESAGACSLRINRWRHSLTDGSTEVGEKGLAAETPLLVLSSGPKAEQTPRLAKAHEQSGQLSEVVMKLEYLAPTIHVTRILEPHRAL